jgi:hypothetical protein
MMSGEKWAYLVKFFALGIVYGKVVVRFKIRALANRFPVRDRSEKFLFVN